MVKNYISSFPLYSRRLSVSQSPSSSLWSQSSWMEKMPTNAQSKKTADKKETKCKLKEM